MKQLEGVKNIIFDLGGVILNIEYQLTIDEFKKLGIDNFEDIFSQYKQSVLSDNFEIGRISELEFHEGIKKISGVDFTFQESKNAWNALLLDLPKARIHLLKKLAQNYRLFLFSNTNETHYNQFVSQVSDEFDSIFEKTYYSHLFGKRKPNKDAFQTILKENNLQASETLFVDDSIQHIKSAESLGISVILIQENPIEVLFD
ncbi:MAG: HAD family phosphatase [Flavobacteriales bacterium]